MVTKKNISNYNIITSELVFFKLSISIKIKKNYKSKEALFYSFKAVN